MLPSILEAVHVTKAYGKHGEIRGVSDVSFSLAAGEVICILGPSGSGKSTLLRLLAGIERPDRGEIRSSAPTLAAYVPQEYTLWPHLTVAENLVLAPTLQGKESTAEIQERAQRLVDRFGVSDVLYCYSAQLSGGQRQRVALLRAIMVRPNILLLDEITSALDSELTQSVLDLIRMLAKDGYAMVIVTHDRSFALSLADRIIFLEHGGIKELPGFETGEF